MHAATISTATTLTKSERRRFPRTVSDTTCTVRHSDGQCTFEVENLSVCGALLTGSPLLPIGRRLSVTLHVPLYPDIQVVARVRRHALGDDGQLYLGIEFVHENDVTEDQIQSAILSELERSQTHGVIPTDA